MLLRIAKVTFRASLDYAAYLFGPQRRRPGQPTLLILMYHRILPKTDPRYAAEEPGMVVEPDTFEMHLATLQRHFTLMPLAEWLSRRHNGQELPPKACAITFDDGWVDNYEYAFPILEHYQVPATLFAVSHMIGTNRMFWPNQLALLLKEPREYLDTLPWLAPHLNAYKQRSMDREVVAAIIEALKAYPDDQIHEWLSQTGPVGQDAPASLMNWDQLRDMASSGLVDIGSHTCHHYRLKEDLPPVLIQKELEESKSKLETALKKPVSLFCYPNGDVCNLALQSIPHHYDAAVTTRRGINTPEANPYELLRIGIHQDRCDTPAKFSSRIANWY